VVSGEPDAAFVREALLAGVRRLDDEGIVSLFIRMHPLLNPDPPDGVGTIVRHGDTVCVDLTLSADDLWSQTRRNHRQQIRQALEAGYIPSIDEGWQQFEAFKSLYRSTMERHSADAYYFFDDSYFDAMRGALGDRLHIAVAVKDGVVAAAGMFVENDGIAQMHLTGHDERYAADQPMKLVFHHVRTWCAERGDRVLHLGGGRGGAEDSLFHFKAGFSPLRRPFHTIRVVVRETEYARLVAARDPDLDPGDLAHRFPLYRERLRPGG
jgi:lipid II:glycine glycyltransferase (peptidoglycan interpeptide bridge formation enzyme)